MTVTSIPDLGNIARTEYKALFDTAIANGLKEPLVLPFCLLGPFLLPTIYLAIPHRNRPWLYHARWLIVAFVAVFDLYLIRYMSSFNVAPAYASGLMGIWGILANLNLLVWTNPQSDYARIIRVPKDKATTASSNGSTRNDLHDTNSNQENGLRQRKSRADAIAPSGDIGTRTKRQDLKDTICVWQKFPENGSFGERLNWTLDLATNFREVGMSNGTLIDFIDLLLLTISNRLELLYLFSSQTRYPSQQHSRWRPRFLQGHASRVKKWLLSQPDRKGIRMDSSSQGLSPYIRLGLLLRLYGQGSILYLRP
jgi:hypothetical protein